MNGELESCRYSGRAQSGFTLIELVVVIIIFAVVITLVGTRTGSFGFWNQEGFIRKLSETISFLHYQALADQATYQIEIDLDKQEYRVGVLRADEDISPQFAALAQDAGNVTLELAAFLNPSLGSAQSFIPPPDFPSLAEPVKFPDGVVIDSVTTMRGNVLPSGKGADSDDLSGTAYLRFSPRGFSEFAVFHLKNRDQDMTLLVNPFTGKVDIIREYREFEWTFGRKKRLERAQQGREE